MVGFVQAAGFGGTNIDPTAWEDKKCPGESRFPAQVTKVIISQTNDYSSVFLHNWVCVIE